jgi:hypothetical protein
LPLVSDREVMTISAPPNAKRLADSKPNPVVPPVMRMVCPCKEPGVGVNKLFGLLLCALQTAKAHTAAALSAAMGRIAIFFELMDNSSVYFALLLY